MSERSDRYDNLTSYHWSRDELAKLIIDLESQIEQLKRDLIFANGTIGKKDKVVIDLQAENARLSAALKDIELRAMSGATFQHFTDIAEIIRNTRNKRES